MRVLIWAVRHLGKRAALCTALICGLELPVAVGVQPVHAGLPKASERGVCDLQAHMHDDAPSAFPPCHFACKNSQRRRAPGCQSRAGDWCFRTPCMEHHSASNNSILSDQGSR